MFNSISRYFLIQTSLIFAALIYTEYTNCLMYISPTAAFYDKFCVILCIIPMLTTAMVECRLFAYFLLIKERFKIMNQSINFYKSNPDSRSNFLHQKPNNEKMKSIQNKIFFIAELRSEKINERVRVKSDNGWKSNFAAKLKSLMSGFSSSIRNLPNILTKKIFADNFEAIYSHNVPSKNHDSADFICNMQAIYTRLCEISDLINKAYGVQIIVIISVQFITLTTLLYYCTMKVIR